MARSLIKDLSRLMDAPAAPRRRPEPAVPGPRPERSTAHAPHAVRIIGGQWRRTLLPVADRPGLRPTPDRVRETLFNWLGQDLSGWRVLDAFAGTGALGFEAASRGAAEVLLLEREPALVAALEATRARLKATQMRVQRADAVSWLRAGPTEGFELVLLDPPFDAGLAAPAVAAAARLVVPDGFIYLETRQPWAIELAGALPAGLTLYREGRAGAVHHALLQRRTPEAASPLATPAAADTPP